MIYRKCLPVLITVLYTAAAFAQAPRIEMTGSAFQWKMTASSAAAANPGTSESGATISAATYVPGPTWLPARVPGTVFTAFCDNGKYTNPYVDRNIATQLFEKNIDLARHAADNNYGYWFRTTFPLDASSNGRQVWLQFKGINYKAQVWVNGTQIKDQDGNLTSVGAFKPFRFNITAVANYGGTNAVAVLILPNNASSLRAWHQPTAQSHGNNGGGLSADGPTFACSEGWDWIPTIPDRNMGMYDMVLLETKGPVTIRYPWVNVTFPGGLSSASLAVSAQLENATAASVSGTLSVVINGQSSVLPVTLAAGQKTIAKLPAITITNPKLWWPNGYGAQDRYTAAFSFEANSAVSDSVTIKFGCRKFETKFQVGSGLQVYINDQRIMCKGGNWGMDEAMKQWDPDHLRGQMLLQKNSNVTMIRNWVGQTDRDLFFDLASEYGILIYNEFWIPNGVDGPVGTDKPLFFDHATERSKRYRNEPCLGLYCVANEGSSRGDAVNLPLKSMLDTVHPGNMLLLTSTTTSQGVWGNGPYN
jgi:beta-mannosidase